MTTQPHNPQPSPMPGEIMPTGESVSLRSYDATSTASIIEGVIVPVWEAVYAVIAADDPFFTTERFLDRLAGYARAPSFSLVTACDRIGMPVGLAFGYALPRGSHWWDGLLAPVPQGFTEEDGHRTFAVNEIMVIERLRRRGIATALHCRLLADRSESRGTLLVEPENTPARTAYLAWGWQLVAPLKPFPDSPTYEAMLIDLPIDCARTPAGGVG